VRTFSAVLGGGGYVARGFAYLCRVITLGPEPAGRFFWWVLAGRTSRSAWLEVGGIRRSVVKAEDVVAGGRGRHSQQGPGRAAAWDRGLVWTCPRPGDDHRA